MKDEHYDATRRSLLQHNIDSFKSGEYSFFTFCQTKEKYNHSQTKAFEAIFKNHKNFIGYGGGMGGGKSWISSMILCLCCVSYPYTTWVLAGKTLVDLKKTSLNTFLKVCDALSIREKVDYEIDYKGDRINFLKTGAVIYLFGLNKDDRGFKALKDERLTGAFIDTGEEGSDSSRRMIEGQVGRNKNDKYNIPPFILETFTFREGWALSKYVTPFKNGKLNKDTEFIYAPHTGNPFLHEAYIRRVESLPEPLKGRVLGDKELELNKE